MYRDAWYVSELLVCRSLCCDAMPSASSLIELYLNVVVGWLENYCRVEIVRISWNAVLLQFVCFNLKVVGNWRINFE